MKIFGYLLDPIMNKYEPCIIQDSIHSYYTHLHCYCIDITCIKICGKVYAVVCDDNGYSVPDPLPCIARPDGTIVGSCFVCLPYDDSGNLSSLTIDDVDIISKHLVTRPDLRSKFGVDALLLAFG